MLYFAVEKIAICLLLFFLVKIFTENQLVIKAQLKILPIFFGSLRQQPLPSPSNKKSYRDGGSIT